MVVILLLLVILVLLLIVLMLSLLLIWVAQERITRDLEFLGNLANDEILEQLIDLGVYFFIDDPLRLLEALLDQIVLARSP